MADNNHRWFGSVAERPLPIEKLLELSSDPYWRQNAEEQLEALGAM